MADIDLDTLTRAVTDYFRKHARKYGLDPRAVEAGYIFNWGGFVNASFHVTDGVTSYHLKLSEEEDSLARLERWMQYHERLSERYHAPRMVDWVRLPRLRIEGGLFAYITGAEADFIHQPQVLEGVLDMLDQLHGDSDLAQALLEEDGEISCVDYFLDLYIDRFGEDLAIVLQDLPPFVPLALYDWMVSETRHLDALCRETPAFQQPAGAPTHGDLWPSNILVTPDGGWYAIDWDDLALGDPALDFSIVLGPLWRDGAMTLEAAEARLPARLGEAGRERFRLCLRAMLLDEVIDTLADWVEAEFVPDLMENVRAAKEQKHREALERYQKLYP